MGLTLRTYKIPNLPTDKKSQARTSGQHIVIVKLGDVENLIDPGLEVREHGIQRIASPVSKQLSR